MIEHNDKYDVIVDDSYFVSVTVNKKGSGAVCSDKSWSPNNSKSVVWFATLSGVLSFEYLGAFK